MLARGPQRHKSASSIIGYFKKPLQVSGGAREGCWLLIQHAFLIFHCSTLTLSIQVDSLSKCFRINIWATIQIQDSVFQVTPVNKEKMFIIKGTKTTTTPQENRVISKRLWGYELKDKKRRETALKAGEDRAILLGLGMVFSSVMMYFVICITMVRAYTDSVLTEETVCTVLNSSLTKDINCSYSCGSDCWRSSKYPCLQVYVSVNTTGRIGLLSHNEEMLDISSECFYVPKCQKDHTALRVMIKNISEHLKMHQQVTCYHDSSEHEISILLNSLYRSSSVFHSLFWPSCMFSGGTLIILMVKLTQYLSIMCEQIGKVPK